MAWVYLVAAGILETRSIIYAVVMRDEDQLVPRIQRVAPERKGETYPGDRRERGSQIHMGVNRMVRAGGTVAGDHGGADSPTVRPVDCRGRLRGRGFERDAAGGLVQIHSAQVRTGTTNPADVAPPSSFSKERLARVENRHPLLHRRNALRGAGLEYFEGSLT